MANTLLWVLAGGLAALLLVWQAWALRKAIDADFEPKWLFVGIRVFNVLAILVAVAIVAWYAVWRG